MAKTTFVVSFGEGAASDSGVVVELEPSLNVDEEGNEKSSFAPGDEVYFTVHYPTTLRVKAVEVTSGDVHFISRSEFDRELSGAFFVDVETAVSLPHIPASPLTFFWYGKVGQLSVTGRDIKAVNPPCIGDISYKMLADLFRYVPPADMAMNNDGQYLSGVVIIMEGV